MFPHILQSCFKPVLFLGASYIINKINEGKREGYISWHAYFRLLLRKTWRKKKLICSSRTEITACTNWIVWKADQTYPVKQGVAQLKWMELTLLKTSWSRPETQIFLPEYHLLAVSSSPPHRSCFQLIFFMILLYSIFLLPSINCHMLRF